MTSVGYKLEMIRAIIGLGNPGPRYYKTRHSIGFRLLDVLADHWHASWEVSDLCAHTCAEIQYPDHKRQKMYLIKPMTYMNDSGKALPFLQKKGIKAHEILVVHDELEKPFGHVSLRLGGSARGHNGLRSIIGGIGEGFWRLRLGIGRPAERELVGEYVLLPFSPLEEEQLPALLARSLDLITQTENK